MKKLVIDQKKIKGCLDSFFYDGFIAHIGNYYLLACGEVIINKVGGECAYKNGSFWDYELEKNLKSDKALTSLVGQNYEDKWHWENNNWFEVVYGEKDKAGVIHIEDCDLGVVEYDYDSAIEMLKRYAKEDTFGKRSAK